MRKPGQVVDEIEDLIRRYEVREIMDDTGCFPVGEWLREFCNEIIKRGINKKIYLDCNMRFGALSEQDYRLMKEAGFRLLLSFLLFFSYFSKSLTAAFGLALFFLTLFSYFVLLFFFQAKKPQQLLTIRSRFCETCQALLRLSKEDPEGLLAARFGEMPALLLLLHLAGLWSVLSARAHLGTVSPAILLQRPQSAGLPTARARHRLPDARQRLRRDRRLAKGPSPG